jgi:VanZ family protein
MLPLRKLSKILLKFSGPLLAGWWLITFSATHMPLSENTRGLPYVDKVAHVFIYMGLALLLSLWLQKHHLKTSLRTSILVVAVLLIYLVIDESLQSLVGRTPDLQDGIADLLGILVGLMLYRQLQRSTEMVRR